MPHRVYPVPPPAGTNCTGTSRRDCALVGDWNNHDYGELIEGGGSPPNTKVRIQNRLVALHRQHAEDDDGGDDGHDDTDAISQSCGGVRIHNQLIHRLGDPRDCGAVTVAFGLVSGRFSIL